MSNHAKKSALLTSTTRPAILAFCTAMDLAALQKRLQQALGQEFTVGPLLGEGGFAAVFRARDNVLNRDVAVKVLDVELAPSSVVAERFLREAQTVARLEHPHIVPIYKSGHALVTDFGIAKAAQAAQAATPGSPRLTSEGMIVGTPEYMSPEQASDDSLDGRSDIYSLGIVLYQMLAGSPPFEGPSSAGILAQQLTEEPDPIRRHRPDVPEEMAVVLDKMLQKNRSKRFQMASEVSRALVGALPTAARDRVHIPLRRRLRSMFYRSLVGLSVAGCLLSIAFAGGAAAVAYYVFSKPPRIAAHAPLPDSLARMLRARGALVAGDVARYAYEPAGQEDSTLLLLTRHRIVVVTPHQVRSYARDSVRRDINLEIHGGLSFRLVIYAARIADTVYRSLSFRDMMQLRPQLNRTEDAIAAPRARPRPRPTAPSKPLPRARARKRTGTRRRP